MHIKEMCAYQRRQIRRQTDNWQERRLYKPQIKATFKFANEAACCDSLSHRSRVSRLTCENARRQSRWLRFTSLNRQQRRESAVLASFRAVLILKTNLFCPRDKNKTAGSRFRNSSRICPKRLREVMRRDSAARRSKPTTKLESTGMTQQ